MVRATLFGLLLCALPAAATSSEEEIATALERLVSEARAGETLRSGLACRGVRNLRPCVLPNERAHVDAVGEALREHFGADHAWVLDWIRGEDDGSTRVQAKVRSAEPPHLIELRFVRYGELLLLADVGSLRPERVAPPARVAAGSSDRRRAEEAMETLLKTQEIDVAARLIACSDAEGGQRLCDIERPDDLDRVITIHDRIRGFVARVGPTGWAFTGYREAVGRGGTWHMLDIGYTNDGERGVAVVALIDADGTLALGDLTDWPAR